MRPSPVLCPRRAMGSARTGRVPRSARAIQRRGGWREVRPHRPSACRPAERTLDAHDGGLASQTAAAVPPLRYGPFRVTRSATRCGRGVVVERTQASRLVKRVNRLSRVSRQLRVPSYGRVHARKSSSCRRWSSCSLSRNRSNRSRSPSYTRIGLRTDSTLSGTASSEPPSLVSTTSSRTAASYSISWYQPTGSHDPCRGRS